jgi:hypothetical protein
MDDGVLLETSTLVYNSYATTSGTRCTYFAYFTLASDHTKFENFPPFSLLLFWKYKLSLFRTYNEIYVGNKAKTFKRHPEISEIYSTFMLTLHYNLGNIAFILDLIRALIYISCIFVTMNKSI